MPTFETDCSHNGCRHQAEEECAECHQQFCMSHLTYLVDNGSDGVISLNRAGNSDLCLDCAIRLASDPAMDARVNGDENWGST